MKALLLDANVLIRFLTQDDPRQSPAATKLFLQAESGAVELHLDALVIAEVVYVLTGRYGKGRSEVISVLLALIQNAGIETSDEVVIKDALRRFGAYKIDFTDAWLAAQGAHLDMPVASFDRDLDKFKDIKRLEPI